MRKRRTVGLLIVVSLIGHAPSLATSPAPSTSGDPGSTIVVGLSLPPFAPSPFFTISNAPATPFRPPGARPELATQLVYNGLYRYDASLAAVPDLAAEPCDVAADLVTITCQLVEARFHDGTPLTADDVAFTFELGRRHPDCLWALGECFGDVLESVTVVDDRTVRFRLRAPDATFLTLVLPSVMIDSRAVVEAAYAPLAARAPTLDAAEYLRSADEIAAQLESADPDCEAPLAGAEALLEAATIEPLPMDQFHQADGRFDACMYAEWSGILLRAIAASLGASGLDAIALAYQALSFNRAPIGTGPWRFVGVEDGTRAIFEAYEGYHRGAPATRRVEIRVLRDLAAATDAMKKGEIHWLNLPPVAPEIYRELRADTNLQFAIFPDATYFMLAYNLRQGRLFEDRGVRTAVELCIDKPSTVDAATDGTGDVLYSPVDPISWAYEADLPRPERDVAEARRLIEGAGWTVAEDGIYQRDGRRLATDVLVLGDDAQRVAFVDLVAAQVRDCGIELRVILADAATVLGFLEYPHIPHGHDVPYDAVFLGWLHGFDPHDDLWHSHSVSSATNPSGPNFMGFADARVDRLLDEGIATYDQRERARIYRQLQRLIADEHPVLFGWSARIYEALGARLGTTDGPLDLSSRQWYWELEKLVLRDD